MSPRLHPRLPRSHQGQAAPTSEPTQKCPSKHSVKQLYGNHMAWQEEGCKAGLAAWRRGPIRGQGRTRGSCGSCLVPGSPFPTPVGQKLCVPSWPQLAGWHWMPHTRIAAAGAVTAGSHPGDKFQHVPFQSGRRFSEEGGGAHGGPGLGGRGSWGPQCLGSESGLALGELANDLTPLLCSVKVDDIDHT